jgi:hypothetical protein
MTNFQKVPMNYLHRGRHFFFNTQQKKNVQITSIIFVLPNPMHVSKGRKVLEDGGDATFPRVVKRVLGRTAPELILSRQMSREGPTIDCPETAAASPREIGI